MANVKRSIIIKLLENGCMLCISHSNSGIKTHPSTWIKIDGKMRKLSRIVWEMNHKKAIGKLHVRHSCDNSWCLNPMHLLAGTHKQNMADMRQRKRGRNKFSLPRR